MNFDDEDHSLAVSGEVFVVLAQALMPAEPANVPFDDPTFRKNLEPAYVVVAFHHFQNSAGLLNLTDQQSG